MPACHVLIFAASPTDQLQLRVGQEIKAIRAEAKAITGIDELTQIINDLSQFIDSSDRFGFGSNRLYLLPYSEL